MSEKTVEDFYRSHSGKVSDKHSSYLAVYERFFAPYREQPIRLLEIGVQNGGSLQIWKKYFVNARVIVGCDVDPRIEQLSLGEGIKLVVGDSSASTTIEKLKAISPEFDIIIDDGSHRSEHIIAAFESLFPIITPGGLFLAEDLHCSYWRSHNGRLLAPFSSIEFFKRLVDVIHFDQWRGHQRERLLSRLLSPFASRRLEALPLENLSEWVKAVHFYNSICIVEKAAGDAGLGYRLTAGQEALVEPAVLKLAEQRFGSH